MQARDNFDPDIKWYTGQGCLVCGANYSPEGEKAGIQCLDLDVDGYDGHLGLCYNHAREVGTHVGMVDQSRLDALEAEMADREASVEALRAHAESMMDAAAADREVVERLLKPAEPVVAPVVPEPADAEPTPKPRRAPKPKDAE